MVAGFQVSKHIIHQPFSRLGPELALHHFCYILLIKSSGTQWRFKGLEKYSPSLIVCENGYNEFLPSLIHCKDLIKRLARVPLMVQRVKDPALSLLWLGLQLWCRFDLWPWNICIPWAWQKKKKRILRRLEQVLCSKGICRLPICMTMCSITFIIREIQVGVTRYHYTLIRMAKMKRQVCLIVQPLVGM